MSRAVESKRPSVGVGVLVFRDSKLLLGKRKSSHGAATWSPPGGHLEWGEAPEVCAVREVLEETGLEIRNLSKGPYTNDVFSGEGKHYVTLFVLASYAVGEAKCLEPEKCEGWEWFDVDKLPSPLFLPLINLLAQGFDPSMALTTRF